MKKLFSSNPILSFILITFSISFFFWFLPVIFILPKDIGLGTFILGLSGPLLSAYIITTVNSKAKFRTHSIPIFILVFSLSFIVLLLRMYYTDNGLSDMNGKMPHLHETGTLAYIIYAISFFILAVNASNATNKTLKENYLKSFIFEKSKWKWYLIVILLFPVVRIISFYVGKEFGINITDFLFKPSLLWLIGFFCTFFFFGGNEEFGWRGFLQKEMQKKYNPLITALVISVLWSFWHLPLYYNGIYTTGGFNDLLPRFLFQVPITIIFTYFYNKSSYSILSVVILHAMLNNVPKAIGNSYVVSLIFLCLICFYFIYNDKMWKKKSFQLVYEK
ncbi:MAG: hypothetical protein C0595_09455 [Marinilabiliales bacterium]|nr:MAG: hypothetical protein C0595_09455 [Marinilabiliales bacterium]